MPIHPAEATTDEEDISESEEDSEQDPELHIDSDAGRRAFWSRQLHNLEAKVEQDDVDSGLLSPPPTKSSLTNEIGGRVCVLCCAPVKKRSAGGGYIRCTRCIDLMQTYYCSEACKEADRKRHKNECDMLFDDECVIPLLTRFRKTSIRSSARQYRVGGSIDHRIDVRRASRNGYLASSTRKSAPIVEGAGEESKGVGVRNTRVRLDHSSAKVGAIQAPDRPLAEWKNRFIPGIAGCAKPWVSFGSPTSVVVSWLPPERFFNAGRYTKHSYELEVRCDGGDWGQIAEPHEGSVPSWVVSELDTGVGVEFRVRCVDEASLADPSGDGAFSSPSDSFRVGYADYSAFAIPLDGLPPNGFSETEMAFFMTLTTPALVQDYLDTIPMDHEVEDDTCLSGCEAVRQNHAHCIEGAMLGAYILSLHGFPPYLMDLRSRKDDDDHVVTPFTQDGRWGCLSVSNHSSLRYRNPVYKTLRELAMSYFDDYMNGAGERTLRAYSRPVHLSAVFGFDWCTRRGDVFPIAEFIDLVPHYKLLDRKNLANVRPADDQVKATTVAQREWQAPDNFDEEQYTRNINK